MIKIRLAKHGSKGNSVYRIVVIDKNRKREGKALEVIGYWHPSKSIKKIDAKKLDLWLQKGAKLTVGVKKLVNKN